MSSLPDLLASLRRSIANGHDVTLYPAEQELLLAQLEPASPGSTTLLAWRTAWAATGTTLLGIVGAPTYVRGSLLETLDAPLQAFSARAARGFGGYSPSEAQTQTLNAETLLQDYIDRQEDVARAATRNAERARDALRRLPSPVLSST